MVRSIPRSLQSLSKGTTLGRSNRHCQDHRRSPRHPKNPSPRQAPARGTRHASKNRQHRHRSRRGATRCQRGRPHKDRCRSRHDRATPALGQPRPRRCRHRLPDQIFKIIHSFLDGSPSIAQRWVRPAMRSDRILLSNGRRTAAVVQLGPQRRRPDCGLGNNVRRRACTQGRITELRIDHSTEQPRGVT